MGKRFTVVIGLLVLSMIFTQFLVVASSEPAELLREHEGAVEEIVELIEGGEKQAAIGRLNSLHSAVVESRASLRGWVFEGSSGKRLTDPFKLPEGTYRVHFTTSKEASVGYATVDVCPLKGDRCKMLFNTTSEGAPEGASSIYRSDGEKVMVELSGVALNDPYKLVFEQLG